MRTRIVVALTWLAVMGAGLAVSGPTVADSGETPWYFATRPVQQSISTSLGECVRLTDGTIDCDLIDIEIAMGLRGEAFQYDASSIGDAAAVSVSSLRACVLHSTGGVSCWGIGYLGDGGTVGSRVPVAVTGISDAVAMSTGTSHTCALRADFTVSCWGSNVGGSVGDGTTTPRATPVAVSGLTNVVAIDAGGHTTCALVVDGTVKCWGEDLSSQQSGATTSVPIVVDGVSSVIAISVGGMTACALHADLTVSCWGAKAESIDRSAQKVEGLSNVATVSVGHHHSCALLLDFSVRCWGLNLLGELGVQASFGTATPVVVPGITNAVAVSAGHQRTCAVLADATFMCWGWQPSSGTLIAPERKPVIDVADAWSVAVGGAHSCALLSVGRVACWGANHVGQLGDGSTVASPTPVEIEGITGATLVAAGDAHSCAAIPSVGIKCWGANDSGQLGDGSTTDSSEPVSVVMADGQSADLGTVEALAAGADHTCALLGNGRVVCWGDNGDGQLGDSTTTDSSVAVLVRQLIYGTTFGDLIASVGSPSKLALGNGFSCVLGGSILTCWGDNELGQLGDGTTTSRSHADGNYRSGMPVGMSPIPPIVDVAAAGDHVCANLDVNADQSSFGIYCWGGNTDGELGVDPSITTSNVPLAVTAATGTVDDSTLVSAGAGHSCASTASTVSCWGDDPSTRQRSMRARVLPAVPPAATTVVALAGHGDHNCVVLASGNVECWGDATVGQTGAGEFQGGPTPVAMAGIDSTKVVLPSQSDLGATTTSTTAETTTTAATTTMVAETTTTAAATTSSTPSALPTTGDEDQPFAWAMLLGAVGALAVVTVRRSPRWRAPG